MTSFWEDRWLSVGRLKDVFPMLYSHVTAPEVSVARIIAGGIHNTLVPRLTNGGREELAKLEEIINRVTLTATTDHRSSVLATENNMLRAGPVYKRLMKVTNRAPPRIKFFSWLLVQERINCRTNLLKKNILDSAVCEICKNRDEDCDHQMFKCPFAAQVWATLEIETEGSTVSSLWTVPRPTTIPAKHYGVFLMLICWELWRHRNDVVFNGVSPSLTRFWTAWKEDASLWSQRWPVSERLVADTWCAKFRIM
ncbi:hypothetical protein HU200_049092 [Digitaria exilis]|uniref:Reverse transcriptase zinc-binding domain-containing protein n=1 Tax=Digitaria exilis TaxID=1010633 RepID=A0A835B570_9POAL|nr:hypothetical protein HU200_049092 [Digitaria exilis]